VDSQAIDRIGLKWDSVSNSNGYQVYYATSETGTYSPAGSTATDVTSYTHAGLPSGITYYYKITAFDSGGRESGRTAAVSGTTPILNVPANLRTATQSIDRITVSWDSVSEATNYQLYYAAAETGTYSPLYTAESGVTSYIHEGLPSGTTYYYKVAALGLNDKKSANSDPVSGATGSLGVPASLRVNTQLIDSISISWNAVSDASGYRLYYAASETGPYTPVELTDAGVTSYTHEGLPSGTTYYYKAAALDNYGGKSADSEPVSGATPVLGIPANLRAEAPTIDSISLRWDPVPEATSYQVYYTTSQWDTYKPVESGYFNGANYMHTGLPSGTGYYYKVTALDNYGGKSGDSAIVSATTIKLATPANLRAEAQSADRISVSWDALPGGAPGYRLYYGVSEWGTGASVDFGSDVTSYTHEGLSSGTLYYYRVAAIDSYGGKSDDSYPVPAVTYFPLNGFNEWLENNLDYGIIHYYRFNAASGVSYKINWRESAGDIKVSAYREGGGETWFSSADSDGGGRTHTASSTGYYILKVETTTNGNSYALRIIRNTPAISGFRLASTDGTINESDKTVAVLVPYATNLAGLIPTLTLASGASGYSPTGAQNFSSPQIFRINMDNGTTQAYTVTVTRKGQGGITINPPPSNSDISIAGFPAASFTVSRSGSTNTRTITISDTSYSKYEWYVDDAQKTADSGSNGRAFTINAAGYTIGTHTVTLIVYKNGAPWSNEVTFTVTN
jgi:fibronectin type 3 domain-containing protein